MSTDSNSVRIRNIFPDPGPFLSVSVFRFYSSHSRSNWIGKYNMYACCLAPGMPTDKENQVKMFKKYRFRYITSLHQ
jgi:hypothetical protein